MLADGCRDRRSAGRAIAVESWLSGCSPLEHTWGRSSPTLGPSRHMLRLSEPAAGRESVRERAARPSRPWTRATGEWPRVRIAVKRHARLARPPISPGTRLTLRHPVRDLPGMVLAGDADHDHRCRQSDPQSDPEDDRRRAGDRPCQVGADDPSRGGVVQENFGGRSRAKGGEPLRAVPIMIIETAT